MNEGGETINFATYCLKYLVRPAANAKGDEYRKIFHDVWEALNPGVLDNVQLTPGQQHVLDLALHDAVYRNESSQRWEIKLQAPLIIAAFVNSIRNEVSEKVDNVVPIKGKPKKH